MVWSSTFRHLLQGKYNATVASYISSPTNSHLVRGGQIQRGTHIILEAYEIVCQPYGLIASNKFQISLLIVKAEF